MALRLGDLAAYWEILLYCLAVAIVGKLLSSFLITRILKCQKDMSLFIGFITIPRGEFSLLISKMSIVGIPFIGPVMVVLAMLTTVISALVLKFSKLLCKVYNICIAFPRSRIREDGEDVGRDGLTRVPGAVRPGFRVGFVEDLLGLSGPAARRSPFFRR